MTYILNLIILPDFQAMIKTKLFRIFTSNPEI